MKTYTLTASGRTGKQWLAHLKKNKYNITSYAEQIILSSEFDFARDKKGTPYEVAIVPNREVGTYSTTAELKAHAAKLGYHIPKPEIALLLREAVSNEAMKEMDVWYIAALHEPIKDAGGDPSVLCACRGDDGRWVRANWGRPGHQWGTEGASAFLVPASTSNSVPVPSLEALSLETRVAALEAILKHHNLGL